MAQSRGKTLDTSDAFPRLELDLVDGSRLTLPFESRWCIFLVYRGHWCPNSHQQLADFQEQGGTILLATHDAAVAERAERQMVLSEGRIDTRGA